ncbi:MAG: esterase/lipase family protein [Sumerlaeia bacterium]
MALLATKPPAEKKSSSIPVLLIPPLLTPGILCMTPLKWALERRGFRTISYNYPSYRVDIPDNATRLAQFLADLDEPELDVVAFSMGNIILRWAANHHEIPKLRRVVMIGPPNQGAFMADWLDDKFGVLFPLFFGKCARQLRRGDKGLAARAGNLPEGTKIGIIAGGTRNEQGYNIIIPGDNDRTVAVSETILQGFTDFVLVPQYHTTLTLRKRSINLACDFIETAQFRKRPAGAEANQSKPKNVPASNAGAASVNSQQNEPNLGSPNAT